MAEKYLTTKDLETRFQVSKGTIAKWRKLDMPFIKVGNTFRYVEAEVDSWFKNHSKDGK